MKRLALSLLLLMLVGGTHALLLTGRPLQPAAPEGDARVDLAGRILAVPRELMRDRAQMAGGRLDRLDLVVGIADFAAPPPSPARSGAHGPQPGRLAIVVRPAGPEPDAATLFQNVHARFLAREAWSNPGGLVMRRFRPGTPYEDRELYLGAGGHGIFVALCPRESLDDAEPCRATLRQDGLEIELRFAPADLPEWRRITAGATRLVAGFAARG
ncbi:hypothetical protein [Rhabdaerophilum calidifontis]|uniref:hypothetical protein n=1 Tax=Rhabdaerophilum calidifontis TaxID=2604328 RepID=UPI00123B58FE|nr:hypothetical protein [Rhabdaerophilum calidifontis]